MKTMFFERAGKFNAVDSNNVLVGFDATANCCEHFDWYLSDIPEGTGELNTPSTLEGFVFDTSYFQEGSEGSDNSYVVFRLVNSEGQEKFLRLSNTHNGYYSHGWSLDIGGTCARRGSL